MRAFRGYECDYVFSCYLLGYDFPIAVLVRTNMLNNILFLKSFYSFRYPTSRITRNIGNLRHCDLGIVLYLFYNF